MSVNHPGPFLFRRIALFGALGIYWLDLWNVLRIDWATNSQYGYGWSVPLIAICLFLQRWRDQPESSPLPVWQQRVLCAVLIMAALLQFPLRLIGEANAEWRILFWCREIQCVILTIGAIALAGGWRLARHFSFPVLFTATAVPWSRFVEDPLIQKMMHTVTAVAVEGLFLLKISALQKGNLIQLANGTVGVGEACSGMRSLQASLMLALAGGELWNLSTRRRWLVVFVGIFGALFLNTARAFLLSVIAETRGFATMKLWHDAFGAIEMSACIVMALGAAWCLRPKKTASSGDTREPIRATSKPEAFWKGWSFLPRLSLALIGIWITAEIATLAWYKVHDAGIEPQWTIAAPSSEMTGFVHFEAADISENERAQLRTNDCLSWKWRQDNGPAWNLSFIRWPAGRSSEACVTAHRPDLCLPAQGYAFVRENPPVALMVNGIPMLFHHYLFRMNEKSVQVFYLLSDLKTAGFKTLESDLSLYGRIREAKAGRRNNRRAILELLVTGADTGAIHSLPGVLERFVTPVAVLQNHL